jgi:hypothetical protein
MLEYRPQCAGAIAFVPAAGDRCAGVTRALRRDDRRTAPVAEVSADLPRPVAHAGGAATRGRLARYPVVRHAWILLAYVALGVIVTWPRATYLRGVLPNTRDQGSYTWGMWWIAHQLEHLASPFTTHQLFAPVGAQLAYHALMPLVGLLMTPLTLTAGPTFSVNLLSVLLPGLLSYAMYRAARLWLAPAGAFASGLFFGLSSMVAWRASFHLNVAAGILFLPITLEAAVRLRRNPSARGAATVGLVIGLCLLVDLQSAVLALIVVAIALVGLLLPRPTARVAGLVALMAFVALVLASPQLLALVHQSAAARSDPSVLARDYVRYSVALPQMFTPSPRVGAFGLHGLAQLFYDGIKTESIPTFGVTLTVLALLGAALGWRRARERWWLVLWLAACVMALGPVLYLGTRPHAPLPTVYDGQTMSRLMPFTWFVRLPGLSGFREANRFTPLGLLAAALLAGSAVAWIRRRAPVALVLVAIPAALELGWSAASPTGTMRAGLPRVDHAIAVERSSSIVVDVPLGFRSGTIQLGAPFPPEALVQATLDEHPRAVGYVSRMPAATAAALAHHAFYAALLREQGSARVSAALVRAARADARRIDAGWVVVWTPVGGSMNGFLTRTGFSLRYRVDGVSVYGRRLRAAVR